MPINLTTLTADVAEFMQDDPRLNVLLRKVEFRESLVKLAIRMMIDHFNHINWRSFFTEGDFPDNTLDIQIYGTVYHLFGSAAILQVRNHLPYNDAGLSVAQFSKSGEYSGLGAGFKSHFENMALALKYEINLEMGWGGVASEYSFYGGYANFQSGSP